VRLAAAVVCVMRRTCRKTEFAEDCVVGLHTHTRGSWPQAPGCDDRRRQLPLLPAFPPKPACLPLAGATGVAVLWRHAAFAGGEHPPPRLSGGSTGRIRTGLISIAASIAWLLPLAGGFAQGPNPKLETFKKFINGEVPIAEAVVYRTIVTSPKHRPSREWWRFGCQHDANTWYCRYLKPVATNSAELRPELGAVGASDDAFWVVGRHDLHIADKAHASLLHGPLRMGTLERGYVNATLSLGFPRYGMPASVKQPLVRWDGLRFSLTVPTNWDRLRTGVIRGELVLGSNGLPAEAWFSNLTISPYPTRYEYAPDSDGIPTAFTQSFPNETDRCVFLSLKLGVDERVEKTGGYLPGMFTRRMPEVVSAWTNEQHYVLRGDQFVFNPAFRTRPVKTKGTVIMAAIAVTSISFLALWYWRSGKKRQTNLMEEK
jgi:hypothetical protein